MTPRRIGSLDVSPVGVGGNNFGVLLDAAQTAEVVHAALDAGITYFDTASLYGNGRSEEFLGAALRGRRDRAVIATKWGHPASLADGAHAGDPKVVRASLEAALRRLGVERVDHFQMHRPDPATPVEETLGALGQLRAEGKIREGGGTVFTAAEIDAVAASAATSGCSPFASIQDHYSVLTRDPERNGVFDACRMHELAFVPFFPLEAGLLTGKYTAHRPPPAGSRLERWGVAGGDYLDPHRMKTVERLAAFAAEHGHTILELAVSWLTSNPLIASVITGCTSRSQVHTNATAGAWALTEPEKSAIDDIVSFPV